MHQKFLLRKANNIIANVHTEQEATFGHSLKSYVFLKLLLCHNIISCYAEARRPGHAIRPKGLEGIRSSFRFVAEKNRNRLRLARGNVAE